MSEEHKEAAENTGSAENQSSGEAQSSASSASSTKQSGYLVATGEGKFACRVGGADYESYDAAEGAGEGDACTADVAQS